MAMVPKVDAIFTRIPYKDCLGCSAFLHDLYQILAIVRNATRNSLVIIDEFGKGTLAEDGASLAAGIICHFATCSDGCPIMLFTTHMTEILDKEIIMPNDAVDTTR